MRERLSLEKRRVESVQLPETLAVKDDKIKQDRRVNVSSLLRISSCSERQPLRLEKRVARRWWTTLKNSRFDSVTMIGSWGSGAS